MVFIIEVIKMFFSKKEKSEELNLTKEQKQKYSKQFRNVMLINTPIFLVLVYGIGDSSYLFLKTGDFLKIALAVVFGLALEQIAMRAKNEMELIEERILKREKRNKKQGVTNE